MAHIISLFQIRLQKRSSSVLSKPIEKLSRNSLNNLNRSAFVLFDQIQELDCIATNTQLVLRQYKDCVVFKPLKRDSKERRSLLLHDSEDYVKLVEVSGDDTKEFSWIKADQEQFISAVQGKCARLFSKM